MEGSVVETYGGGKLDAERAVGCGCEEACEHNGSIQRQTHLCGSAGGGEGFIFLAVHLQQQVETAEFTRALIEQQKAAQQPPGGPLAC